MKDGFNGRSPGRRLCGLQVIDDTTLTPIGIRQSLKRNVFILFGVVPFGGFVTFVLVIIIITQMAKGYRLFDRYARTRVVWLKYASLPVFGGNKLQCEKCGYDLAGNESGVCPECGTPISDANMARLGAPALASEGEINESPGTAVES